MGRYSKFLKYAIHIKDGLNNRDIQIALTLNMDTRLITIKGPMSHMEYIYHIYKFIYKRKREPVNSSRYYRIYKIEFKSTAENFFKGIKLAREEYHVQEVKKFDRLIG